MQEIAFDQEGIFFKAGHKKNHIFTVPWRNKISRTIANAYFYDSLMTWQHMVRFTSNSNFPYILNRGDFGGWIQLRIISCCYNMEQSTIFATLLLAILPMVRIDIIFYLKSNCDYNHSNFRSWVVQILPLNQAQTGKLKSWNRWNWSGHVVLLLTGTWKTGGPSIMRRCPTTPKKEMNPYVLMLQCCKLSWLQSIPLLSRYGSDEMFDCHKYHQSMKRSNKYFSSKQFPFLGQIWLGAKGEAIGRAKKDYEPQRLQKYHCSIHCSQ